MGEGVGLAAILFSGTISMVSWDWRAAWDVPIEECLPFLPVQRRLARRETSPTRDELGLCAEALAAFLRWRSAISHLLRFCPSFQRRRQKNNRKVPLERAAFLLRLRSPGGMPCRQDVRRRRLDWEGQDVPWLSLSSGETVCAGCHRMCAQCAALVAGRRRTWSRRNGALRHGLTVCVLIDTCL